MPHKHLCLATVALEPPQAVYRQSPAGQQALLLHRKQDAIEAGMRALWLLLIGVVAGCHVLTPMPGHITHNVSESQMEVVLKQHLKPGMPIRDACAFLKNEDFTMVHQEQRSPESSSILMTRREQADFWVHQDWKITLDCKNEQLQDYSIRQTQTGP